MSYLEVGTTVQFSEFFRVLENLPEGDSLLMTINALSLQCAIVHNEEGDYSLIVISISENSEDCEVLINETFPTYMRAMTGAIVLADMAHMGA
jgi:hypothetical protein